MKTCTPEVICDGFRRAGIVPFDPEIVMQRFPDSDDTESSDLSFNSALDESSKSLLNLLLVQVQRSPQLSPQKRKSCFVAALRKVMISMMHVMSSGCPSYIQRRQLKMLQIPS